MSHLNFIHLCPSKFRFAGLVLCSWLILQPTAPAHALFNSTTLEDSVFCPYVNMGKTAVKNLSLENSPFKFHSIGIGGRGLYFHQSDDPTDPKNLEVMCSSGQLNDYELKYLNESKIRHEGGDDPKNPRIRVVETSHWSIKAPYKKYESEMTTVEKGMVLVDTFVGGNRSGTNPPITITSLDENPARTKISVDNKGQTVTIQDALDPKKALKIKCDFNLGTFEFQTVNGSQTKTLKIKTYNFNTHGQIRKFDPEDRDKEINCYDNITLDWSSLSLTSEPTPPAEPKTDSKDGRAVR